MANLELGDLRFMVAVVNDELGWREEHPDEINLVLKFMESLGGIPVERIPLFPTTRLLMNMQYPLWSAKYLTIHFTTIDEQMPFQPFISNKFTLEEVLRYSKYREFWDKIAEDGYIHHEISCQEHSADRQLEPDVEFRGGIQLITDTHFRIFFGSDTREGSSRPLIWPEDRARDLHCLDTIPAVLDRAWRVYFKDFQSRGISPIDGSRVVEFDLSKSRHGRMVSV